MFQAYKLWFNLGVVRAVLQLRLASTSTQCRAVKSGARRATVRARERDVPRDSSVKKQRDSTSKSSRQMIATTQQSMQPCSMKTCRRWNERWKNNCFASKVFQTRVATFFRKYIHLVFHAFLKLNCTSLLLLYFKIITIPLKKLCNSIKHVIHENFIYDKQWKFFADRVSLNTVYRLPVVYDK